MEATISKVFAAKKQHMSFYDNEGNSSIKREILYPIHVNQQKICQYFQESISRKTRLCLGDIEGCLCFVNDSELMNRNKKMKIDSYWIDGEVYLIEYIINNNQLILKIAIDITLDKEKIFDLIRRDITGTNIRFIDQIDDCWIKREGE